jgi:hypothetical protein
VVRDLPDDGERIAALQNNPICVYLNAGTERESGVKRTVLEVGRSKMSKAEQYRQIAAECQVRATRAQDHDDQQEWSHLAEQWRDLARQVEPDEEPPD